MNESLDPRWDQLRNRSWSCASCGEAHHGLFDLGCDKPDFWQDSEAALPNSAVRDSNHCLTQDFCVLEGEHYFIRCVVRVPLIGAQYDYFAFGVWSTLSKKNFDIYTETFDSGEQEQLGPWFGWFSNRLKGYPDTLNLKCQVHPQGGRQRPWIEVEAVEHPLAGESREGITYERLLEIYGAYGHSRATDRVE